MAMKNKKFIFQGHQLLAKLFVKIVKKADERSRTSEKLTASHSNPFKREYA